jgi:hypothetical protein
VACVRELFEEAGILMARDAHGRAVRFDEEEIKRRFAEHRRALNAGERRFLDIVAGEGLTLDLSALEYVAHRVTPVGPPRRYDTRFLSPRPAGTDRGPTTTTKRWPTPGSGRSTPSPRTAPASST